MDLHVPIRDHTRIQLLCPWIEESAKIAPAPLARYVGIVDRRRNTDGCRGSTEKETQVLSHLFEYLGRVFEWPWNCGFCPLSKDLVYQNEIVGWTRSTHDRFVRLQVELPTVSFGGDGVVNDLDGSQHIFRSMIDNDVGILRGMG